MTTWRREEVLSAIEDATSVLKIGAFKPTSQKEVMNYILGRNIFVSLPSSYSHLIIHHILLS